MVSIIIVNYNTEDVLANCLESVYEKTENIDFEVVVVDNKSQEGSLGHLQSKYPTINFLFLDKNLGFGQANNEGAKLARGKYLLLLNPDTLLVNNAVKILYEYNEQNPDVGICGGALYKENLTPAKSYHCVDFLRREYKIIFNRARIGELDDLNVLKEVNVIMGADLFLSKSLFVKFGGFDADFFMYFEEVELCLRIKNEGYKIMFVPDAKIIHLEGASAENKNEELGKWSYKEHWYSKLVFFHKAKGRAQTALVYRISLLKLQFATFIYRLRGDDNKISYWKTKEKIMHEVYNRYLAYLNNIKVR